MFLVLGEEQPGGLVIVRAPTLRPSSPQNNTLQPNGDSSHLSRRLSPVPQSLPSSDSLVRGTSRPPSIKPKTGPSRAPTGGDRCNGLATMREEPELDEDVRRMEVETNDLRRRSQAKESTTQSSQRPHSIANSSSERYPLDALQPIAECETPQIERNKLLREGQPLPRRREPSTPHSSTPQHSRRSSLSMRGKRISTSFENTGVICASLSRLSCSCFDNGP